ncbi:MAG: aldo/keto reductase [Chitinophagales bacterium]|nr:aldo/keto reductase [Chitinophagales bacterium]MDW8427217.1 aldo/keto reductase [Chitinophagales bacterium]
MQYRKLGRSGLPISAFSLGSWITFGKQIGDDVAEKLMKVAYENGINFFDNAEVYARGRSEKIMGKILKKMGWDRDSYLVSSKVFFGAKKDSPLQRGLHRKHIVEACEQAMKRLHVDYLDLYFCHRPDPEVPIDETVWMMNVLIRQGKILYWGTSEWSAEQITEAYTLAEKHHLIGPTMEQPQYNLLHRHRVEVEYAVLYARYGLGTTIWSPLASGLLTGKYLEKDPGNTRLSIPGLEWLRDEKLNDEAARNKVLQLKAIADNLGISLTRLSLAWCLKNPHVSTVILGASRVEQLKENLTALEVVDLLTPDVMKQIDQAVA